VSDFEKRVDPNATIQLDKIDVQELVQLEEEAAARAAAEESKPPPAVRKTAPPPLPPMLPEASTATAGSLAPPTAQVAAPARGTVNTKFYAVAVLLLLASTIALGIAFRARSRAEETAPVAESAAPSASAPAAQPSTHTLTLPAVEITGP
jgi:hypothetical protein